MKRPVLFWVVLFVLGEVCLRLLPKGINGFLLLTAFAAACLLPKSDRERKLYVIGVFFLLFGMVCWHFAQKKILFCEGLAGMQVFYEGSIVDVEELQTGYGYVVRTSRISGRNIHLRLNVAVGDGERIWLGSKVCGNGQAEPFCRASNPGEYDERDNQYGKGIYLLLKKGKITQAGKGDTWEEDSAMPIRERLYRFRQYIARIYERFLGERDASVAKAMVLGEKSGLDSDIRQLYQRNGIAHLIAISGLHLAMIGGIVYQFVRRLSGSYLAAAVSGVAFTLVYGIMTGLSAATLRAGIMFILSIGAKLSGRKYDALTAVFAALLLMLSGNPYQLTQVGFLLSFGAVLGIAVIWSVWKVRCPSIPRWLNGLMVSVSVQLVLMPVQLYFFYEIPIYGVWLNIFVVPLMSVLLPLLLGCGLLAGVLPPGADLLAFLAKGIFMLYEMLCRGAEKLPGHTLCTGRPSAVWVLLYYTALGFMLAAVYYRRQICRNICFVLMFVLILSFCLPGRLTVTLLDVGQGDGIYIRTPGNSHIMVDGGSSSRRNLGRYVLKNGVKYYGAGTLDYVFISHSDSDHYSGIAEILEEDIVPVRNIVLPAITNPDEAYRKLEMLAAERQSRIIYMKAGDKLMLDGVSFVCLSPKRRAYTDKNQGSMVLYMSYREFDMLFTGDMDKEVEKELGGQIRGPLEVLKVAHHGSATASSEGFLARVLPVVSCVSVGENNTYGHPADEVMERLRQFSQRIYLTKDSGAITIKTNGYRCEITPFFRMGKVYEKNGSSQ